VLSYDGSDASVSDVQIGQPVDLAGLVGSGDRAFPIPPRLG